MSFKKKKKKNDNGDNTDDNNYFEEDQNLMSDVIGKKKKKSKKKTSKDQISNVQQSDDLIVVNKDVVNTQNTEIQGKVSLNGVMGLDGNVNIDTKLYTDDVIVRGGLNTKKDIMAFNLTSLFGDKDLLGQNDTSVSVASLASNDVIFL